MFPCRWQHTGFAIGSPPGPGITYSPIEGPQPKLSIPCRRNCSEAEAQVSRTNLSSSSGHAPQKPEDRQELSRGWGAHAEALQQGEEPTKATLETTPAIAAP